MCFAQPFSGLLFLPMLGGLYVKVFLSIGLIVVHGVPQCPALATCRLASLRSFPFPL